ncbi:MAG: DUF72 domain-containing protein [Candidatus Thorarchaeota archaeon]
MQPGLHIGTSGWSYKEDWKGIFYHPHSPMLQQYFSYFDTAEINSSFYSLPRPSVVERLRTGLPESKFFTAKLPKDVTHNCKLHLNGEGGAVLEKFFELMHILEPRLEALLIQLPPFDISTMGDLETFLASLDTSFRYAIEFRHESWLSSNTWNMLEKYQIAHCVVDEPKLQIDTRVTTDFSYIRWHGHGEDIWYKYRYSLEELEKWRPLLSEIHGQTDTILGYFNNHFFGYAPFNALQMLQLLEKSNPLQDEKLEKMKKAFSQRQTTLDFF